ncbi:acyl-CoA N-acyltransferase [Glonium stellatum]|uniref:Acyl-CoA N-acyltransferase n=1 Tax=Glonium stellatum TaxID=574774 RepID=A0A8E2F2D9_9PEZI|nr:acyl-CoA N-acyltransferase [Glonium stellatum]
MALPPQWQSDLNADPHLGHKEDGRTICLHSLAVLPDYQNQGLGKLLVLAYIERMKSSGVADRIALITYDRLVPFYERLGFEYLGKSEVNYAGGGWNDMVLEFKNIPETIKAVSRDELEEDSGDE